MTTSGTDWERRLARPKGFTSYAPDESFVIHVQWVVTNRTAADTMLGALHRCAEATQRDTPPVLAYFFRISHDQRLAEAMKEAVTSIGDHPQYKKLYKLASMNIPLQTIIAGCKRDGLNPAPFEEGWPSDSSMTAERAARLGFDPVVLDATEIYLDCRAFFQHAESTDYQKAYSLVMQPHHSLATHVVVAGNPSTSVWDRVLEPSLKARRAEDSNEKLLLCEALWPRFSPTKYILLDIDFDDATTANQFVTALDAPYKCVFASAGASSKHRVIAPVLTTTTVPDMGGAVGRAVVFGGSECDSQLAISRIDVVAAANAASVVTGYGVSERVGELNPQDLSVDPS